MSAGINAGREEATREAAATLRGLGFVVLREASCFRVRPMAAGPEGREAGDLLTAEQLVARAARWGVE